MLLRSMTQKQKSCAKYYSFMLPGIQVMKKHFQIFCLGKFLARHKEIGSCITYQAGKREELVNPF